MSNRFYACIDLKSFYASVECVERNLNPLDTHLVVADARRTEKTICLAISPSLKSYGLPGRARLFEVKQKIEQINRSRQRQTSLGTFLGKSSCHSELLKNPNLELDFVIAPPRMAHYIDYSTKIYQIYLSHLAPCDIFPYSIDEVFCDITDYLHYTNSTPRDFVTKMIHEVYEQTGITATAGIGTNLYLAKIAMDIVAKHTEPDENGARIAELTEQTYRETLWTHQPITDFWRIGPGYAKKLYNYGLRTMGDVARCSLIDEDFLYKLFGVNAELLIDHAWGYEPCQISDIKNYRPKNHSVGAGQVLHEPYNYQKTELIVKEMADALALDLTAKHLVTNQITLTVSYDASSLKNYPSPQNSAPAKTKSSINLPDSASAKNTFNQKSAHHASANSHIFAESADSASDISTHLDRYGRRVPTHAHGTSNLQNFSASASEIIKAALDIFHRTVNPNFFARRVTITAGRVIDENSYNSENIDKKILEQLDLFTNPTELEQNRKNLEVYYANEKRLQVALLDIKRRYGKNAIFRAMNLEDGSTALSRHQQIGGHQA